MALNPNPEPSSYNHLSSTQHLSPDTHHPDPESITGYPYLVSKLAVPFGLSRMV
jgi:hypothetical protein